MATALSISAAPSYAAVINVYDPAINNRYTSGTMPNPGFLLNEADLSGIGGAAALITPRHFVTAAHVGVAPFTATFRGLDGISRSYTTSTFIDLMTTYDSGAGTTTTASDIRMYTLSADVSPQVLPIAIALGTPGAFIGRTITILGSGNQAGKNIVDDVLRAELTSFGTITETVAYSFDTAANGGSNGLGDLETGLIGGDSGRQALIEVDGQIALIGTNLGISSLSDANARNRYDSYTALLSPYWDQIVARAALTGHTVQTVSVVAVPEPSSLVAMTVMGLMSVVQYRRRRCASVRIQNVGG